MTPAQEAFALAWEDTLCHRGLVLTIGGSEVRAVVEPIDPERTKYIAGANEREMSRIHVARLELPAGIEPGMSFEDETNGFTHRITAVRNDPTSVKVVFTCETTEVL